MDHPPDDDYVLARRTAVGSRIRSLRQWRNLTQPQLAELAGCDRQSVYRAELATQSTGLDVLIRLAYGLRVPPVWLLSDDWSHNPGGDIPGEGWRGGG